MTKRDNKTLDLFEIPRGPELLPGALDIDHHVRGLVSKLLKDTPLSRYQVAARMSELIGVEVSKHQLDAWTAESRDGWRFPLAYVPAFEAALGTYAITQLLAEKRGCTVNIGADALLAELGKIEHQEMDLKARKAALKQQLRDKR
jgi:hypothetical protein